MSIDWYATLKIATAAAELAQYPESQRVYLPNGHAPAGEWGGPLPTIKLGRLAKTLKRLAQAGADDFYRGELAQKLVTDLTAGGSKLSAHDLATYQARVLAASDSTYRSTQVYSAPGLTAGPSLRQSTGSARTNTYTRS